MGGPMSKVRLPIAWYSTIPEVAHDWGVHPDRIHYCLDAGRLEPGVLVPKAELPFACPGPAPHVCVLLPEYRRMAWQPLGSDRVAPLAGEYRAYQVDCNEFTNLRLEGCDEVYVSRSQLVIPLDQREALEEMGANMRGINPTERRTFLHIIRILLKECLPDQYDQPYAMAETISRDLECVGIPLSRQAIANKLVEALQDCPRGNILTA